MRIYLAARYSRRGELCEYRRQLESMGHTVTSRWLNGSHQVVDDGMNLPGTTEQARQFAEEDIEDLLEADAMVTFTEPPRSGANRGGRHVEFGIWLGHLIIMRRLGHAGKLPRLVVVGYRENVFHCLPCVEVYSTWAEALEAIGEAK